MTPADVLRRAAPVLHAALIVSVALREHSKIGLVLAVALAVPMPGIALGRTYTCAWASMLVTFFVGGYLAAGYARPDSQVSAFVVATIAALDFVSLVLFVRFRGREAAARAARERSAQTAASGGAGR